MFNSGFGENMIKRIQFKDRQHRSRGGFTFSYIVYKPKGLECRTICQINALIFLNPLILNGKWSRVYEAKYKIKCDFFTFIFLC